jgi:hypothetical protein
MDLHWGTMHRRYSLPEALAQAVSALTTSGYEVWNDPAGDGYFVLGGNHEVNVTILVVPEGDESSVAVIVDTSNGTAVAVRTRVRALIPEAPAPTPMPPLG